MKTYRAGTMWFYRFACDRSAGTYFFNGKTDTHHDVKDLVNHGMVKNTKTWITWEWNITFLQNKKIRNLCLRWHILRSYSFVGEVIFNQCYQVTKQLVRKTQFYINHASHLKSVLKRLRFNQPQQIIVRNLNINSIRNKFDVMTDAWHRHFYGHRNKIRWFLSNFNIQYWRF